MSLQDLQVFTNFALLGFFSAALWAPVLINLLYKMNIVVRHVLMSNKMNEEFIKIHAHKSGTPTMGGLIISVVVLLWVILLIPTSPIRTVFIIGWSLTTLYGFIEGSLVFARKVDEKFKLMQESFVWRIGKLGVLYLLALLIVYLIKTQLGIDTVTLLPGVEVATTPLAILFGAFGVVLSMYGMEITDGADGLVTGQFIIATITYGIISVILGRVDFLPYLGLILGASFVYLYFNINPARVFMGGTGTLPIGFTLILFALVTNTLPVFVVMGIVFWVELASSFIQIMAIRVWKVKVFRIAPLHHHFEAKGWSEAKVVQRFWLGSAVASLAALWVFSLL